MLVRVKQHKTSKIGGISLIAVTKYIIASTIVFSFVVALIFWILEHQNDKHASRKLSFAHSTRHKADWQSKKYSRASFSFIYIYIYMAFVELVVIIGKHALVGIVKAQLGMYSLLVC